MMTGLTKPKTGRIGIDLAGEVEAVGKNVTQFKSGDAVFGHREGALAEYVCATEDHFAPKPERLSFEQAAGINIAGVTALQALRDSGNLRAGQSVIINGASGGVGTFAVQIARSMGARVTGVCSTRNLDFIRSLGAEDAIDYTKGDFTRSGRRFDLLLETVGNLSFRACRRLLNPSGTGVLVGAPHGGAAVLGYMFKALVAGRFGRPRLRLFMSQTSQDDLLALNEMIDAGRLMPVVDRSYPLREVRDAMQYLEEGHARGKVVVAM
jgi:NADPH:quinone reductase-like Zn-dependent oxidoreductase